MADHEGTPRSLRVSFEFEIPRQLRTNIRGTEVNKALDTFAGRIIGLAESLVPWASRVTVRKQWVYPWTDDTEIIDLPETGRNTP